MTGPFRLIITNSARCQVCEPPRYNQVSVSHLLAGEAPVVLVQSQQPRLTDVKRCCAGHKQPCNKVWSLGVGVRSAHALDSSTCSKGRFFNRYRNKTTLHKLHPLHPCRRNPAQTRQPLGKPRLQAFGGSRVQENTLLEVKSLHARVHQCVQR